MAEWVDVASVGDIESRQGVIVEVDGTSVVIFNLDGEYYALEDVCTHDGAEIASGCLVGDAIECPRHGARFDIRTGAVEAPPAYEPLQTFPIRINSGVIQVCDDRWD
ncbi:MAG: ferredoxin [Acidiferrobacteraceae bacterium]|jgi:3-phenylpropionate/trans-cinnamate dioxygenase ferredoxin subunit|nr:ferredoxin [Acidiferrobacteraceae bacterium]HAU10175.1 ferredoxin [Gammaproteobacteria bacterium]|tara:strand:- start:2243 stop:2563 length:321 start_codon:yes stop_codon:yes gene_type:complete